MSQSFALSRPWTLDSSTTTLELKLECVSQAALIPFNSFHLLGLNWAAETVGASTRFVLLPTYKFMMLPIVLHVGPFGVAMVHLIERRALSLLHG